MSIFDKIAAAVTPPESAEDRAEARRCAADLARGDDWLATALDHHRRIEALFEQARAGRDAAARTSGMKQLGRMLTGHSIAEESVLYPMLAQSHSSHAAHAYQEQATAKIEMHKLEMLEPMSQEWLDKLEHIRGAVQHHMYEEEGTWFPELRKAVPDGHDAMLTRRFREEFDRYMGGADSAAMERPLQMAAEMDDSGARQSENTGPLDY